MDSTEARDGGAIEQREPSNLPPASPEAPTGAVAGATAEVNGPEAASGETSPDAQSPADPMRRRRRRRRRRPSSPGPTAGGSVDREADGPAGDLNAAATGGSEPSSGGEMLPEGETPERPILKLRNRRRRHRRPHGPGLLPGAAAPTDPTSAVPPATSEGEPAVGETVARTATALPPGARSFSAPRRRRRHAPLAATVAPETTESADAAASGAELPANRRPRRRRRPRAALPGAPAEGAADTPPQPRQPRARGARPPGERGGEQRPGGGRDGPRDMRGERRDRRDRPGGPGGRGRREAPRAPVARKLYTVDSVVDRGFDDVEEETGTRRVHWTIVKRTTADQVSRKALSALYVLQRDGSDSEFPSLGAARDAVNKKIVHPEKLTRSKEEYAAERKK